MLGIPAIVGISLGVSAFSAFTGKNKEKPLARRMLYFVIGFVGSIIALLAVNFVIYASNH